HLQGVNWSHIDVIDAGSADEIEAAFRSGQGDFAHLQGPAPQALELDGVGFVAASVGEAMPPVAFSSLCASRQFLGTDLARAFLRAYRKSREWVCQAKPGEVARAESTFFPNTPAAALTKAIAQYQSLGSWDGDLRIGKSLYEQALT